MEKAAATARAAALAPVASKQPTGYYSTVRFRGTNSGVAPAFVWTCAAGERKAFSYAVGGDMAKIYYLGRRHGYRAITASIFLDKNSPAYMGGIAGFLLHPSFTGNYLEVTRNVIDGGNRRRTQAPDRRRLRFGRRHRMRGGLARAAGEHGHAAITAAEHFQPQAALAPRRGGKQKSGLVVDALGRCGHIVRGV